MKFDKKTKIIAAIIILIFVIVISIPGARNFLIDFLSYYITDSFHSLSDSEFFFNKGVKYTENGHLYFALKTFRKNLLKINKFDPYYKESLYNTGVLYYNAGKKFYTLGKIKKSDHFFLEAKKVWSFYQQLYPEDQSRIEEFASAQAYIDSLDEQNLNPEARKFKDLGQKEFYKKNYDKALEYYFKAVEIEPKYDTVWNNIGSVYYFKQQYTNALNYWEKAVKINPNDNRELYLTMGSVSLKYLKDNKRAIYFLKNHLKLNPKDPQKNQIKKMIKSLETGDLSVVE